MSITCLPTALERHSEIASATVEPCGWMMKSTWQVVPPKAAEAREHVLPARGDHLVRARLERLADQRDGLVLDVDVRDVVVGGGHDPPALDQNCHAGPPRLTLAASVEESGPPRKEAPIRASL